MVSLSTQAAVIVMIMTVAYHHYSVMILKRRGRLWEYLCAAVGYVVGFGSIVWLLLLCRSFREKYFGKIEEVVENMHEATDMRRRRARRAAATRN